MRFVVIGVGAVGSVLGVSLEHGKHDVLYLLRKGRKAAFRDLQLVDASRGEVRRRDAPLSAEEGAKLPPFEWALLCVRGDQLDEGIATLKAHMLPTARVGVASASLNELERVRAAHPDGPVFSITPTFSAWIDEPRVVRWFTPPLLRTLLSGEGDPAAQVAAKELAAALVVVGVPAQAVTSARKAALPMVAAGSALLGGWELAGWDARALGGDVALRSLTAGAIHEAARVVRAEVDGPVAFLLATAPAAAIGLLLRGLPQLTRGNVATMWSHHGPKIAAQTRVVLDDVLARAAAKGEPAERLRALRDRLGAPPVVAAPLAPPVPPKSAAPAAPTAPTPPVGRRDRPASDQDE